MYTPAIEPTSRCNYKCKHCPFQHNNIDKGDMDFELFKKIVDTEIFNADAIQIFNRGEPFLHPRVYEMIEYIKCKVILSTNAVLVDVDRLYKIPGEKLICVSFPGGNAKTYQEITGARGFTRAKSKVIELQDKKPDNVELYVKMVKQPENEGQDSLLRAFCNNVVVIDDSNQDKGYTVCSQPDVTPVYRYDGKKVVCCRDVNGSYDWDMYRNSGKQRLLPICKQCGIQ